MKTIFFDVDTQLDFLLPAGALYVPGAEKIAGNLARLTRYAAANSIQIVSTMDAHAEDDTEFKVWRPHCVVDTAGQQKLGATLLPKRAVVPNDPAADPQATLRAPQIIIEKQSVNAFTNPHLNDLLDAVGAERFVVYGVVSEVCVRYALDGLLKRHNARVELVTDAIKSLDEHREREMIAEFVSQGGLVTTTTAALCH